MSPLRNEDRRWLLQLARSVIVAKLDRERDVDVPDNAPAALKEKRGCFVTLHKKGRLRGCIGTIEPVQSLVAGVRENALNAAFQDPRFPGLEKKELAEISIEISVLTVPVLLEYEDIGDLKAKLRPGVHGVILSKGWQRSTFLPQVWEQLPDKELFLSHLCHKAGMKKECWKGEDIKIRVYEAEYFSE
ncbi:hypothetical protein DENIS_0042 [Desulfonema ishimotonii]|uniref:AMMECR1 domain-containing protein n=2 Tax=Desulfonema ishimotonii TaxID=45657 RepID=A0A401FQ61_9BACT|nr:hypothetical protein DENIS_0042 [Desulfonema ishimotonii]